MALESTALTDAIDAAFATEWAKVKTIPLPGAGKEDRRLLFAAVARGLLEYLQAQQNDVITKITLTEAGASKSYDVRDTALNINVG